MELKHIHNIIERGVSVLCMLTFVKPFDKLVMLGVYVGTAFVVEFPLSQRLLKHIARLSFFLTSTSKRPYFVFCSVSLNIL